MMESSNTSGSMPKAAKHILRCQQCRTFTMKAQCSCGGTAVLIVPPKYSPEDKYGDYRRKVKRQAWESQGYL